MPCVSSSSSRIGASRESSSSGEPSTSRRHSTLGVDLLHDGVEDILQSLQLSLVLSGVSLRVAGKPALGLPHLLLHGALVGGVELVLQFVVVEGVLD